MRALLHEETRTGVRDCIGTSLVRRKLITRYINMRALDGVALVCGSEVVGYCYWVTEDHKAILGDLYVRDFWRSPEVENQLLNQSIETLRHSATLPALAVRRVESQLMQVGSPAELLCRGENAPLRFPRIFMLRRSSGCPATGPSLSTTTYGFSIGDPVWFDSTAELIAQVYRGHVDSQINDQYQSNSGAERFLRKHRQLPWMRLIPTRIELCPLSILRAMFWVCVIATRVAPETGHIAQVCAANAHLGRGLGYELLRRSMLALQSGGCHEVSLTVTESNLRAQRLYSRMGFPLDTPLPALVWDH